MKLDKPYLKLLKKIREEGTYSSDRTGTGMYSCFGESTSYDLSKAFPLLTTKKMAWKWTVHELVWMLSGSNDVAGLRAKGVKWWDSWARKDDDTIGHGYGTQFRNLEYLRYVEPKIYEPEFGVLAVAPCPEIKYETDTRATKYRVGQEVETRSHGKGILLEEIRTEEKYRCVTWRVWMQDTGSILTITRPNIISKTWHDPLAKTLFGVGYYGDDDPEDPYRTVLLAAWTDMLRRCYNTTSNSYKYYGAKGYHVDNRWHCFATFQKEAKQIFGWSAKVEFPKEYSLDKDLLWASNRYSKETCCWASSRSQMLGNSTARPFYAVNKEGRKELFFSSLEMSGKYGVDDSTVRKALKGKVHSVLGWTNFEYVEEKSSKVTKPVIVDQLKYLLCELKHNPDSRRHIITLYNPLDIGVQQLPPCHGNIIQFHIQGDTLHCGMYQRSCDIPLGGPVNIASYALLTLMIAKWLGKKPGKFTHFIGVAHIYANQLKAVDLQLIRTPRESPTVSLEGLFEDSSVEAFLSEVTNLTPEKIGLLGYDPDPAIPAPISV